MTQSRRIFVKNGMAVATGLSLGRSFVPTESLFAKERFHSHHVPSIDDPKMKAIIQRGLDAARSMKADYADIRFTHVFKRDFTYQGFGGTAVYSTETVGVGVRAMVNGYWGGASSPLCHPDELVRLAKVATALAQAASTAHGRAGEMQLLDRPVVRDGHWTTPIKIDPFTIHPSYFMDHIGRAINNYARTRPYVVEGAVGVGFKRVEKAFGATDGSYFTQRLYTSGGSLTVQLNLPLPSGGFAPGSATSEMFPEMGAGYEMFDEIVLRQEVDRLAEQIPIECHGFRQVPLEVGRYDTIIAPRAVANLVSRTIAAPAQLDRALGFEANAAGTSYLNDPDVMIGAYQLASPIINVTGDRTRPGGVATVAWDDDGVVPIEVPLVTKGVLTNYLTSRDIAGVARTALPVYGKALTSNGCSQSPTAIDEPLIHTPNLTLHASDSQQTFESLCEDLGDGIAIGGPVISSDSYGPIMDQQLLNGYMQATFYSVKKGKIVGPIEGGSILFRSPEFWKSIKAIGGPSSVRQFALDSQKGQPSQSTSHTVSCVPMLVEKLTLIDARRKA